MKQPQKQPSSKLDSLIWKLHKGDSKGNQVCMQKERVLNEFIS